MATNNTTEPITLRGGFLPVLRYGNFAGPGYAGGLGLETLIEHPDINDGKPILASELTKTPQGVAQFMRVALQTDPNGYLDGVTRNHDVEYTFAEIRFMTNVQAQFDGKLPHELTAQEKQDPAFKQLETARDGEYWQADQRMLTSVAQYQPTDFVDSSYRAIALTAFYNKAESGLFGYGLGPEVKDFYTNLKTIDSKITTPTLGDSLTALGTATSLARGDFEALATLPLTPQERQFFNSHLKLGQQLDVSTQNADGNPISYDEKDSSNRIVVPEGIAKDFYAVTTKIGGDTVTMTLDKSDKDNPVFTKEIVHNGEVVSTETIRPTDQVKEGETAARSYESILTDKTGQILGTKTIAKPELPDSTIPSDLQVKIDAVKSGDVAQIVAIPAVHNGNGVDGSDVHFSHYPANTTTGSATPSTTPNTSPTDGSDAHLNHYLPTDNTGATPVVHVTVGPGTASNGTDATTSTGPAPSAKPDEPQGGYTAQTTTNSVATPATQATTVVPVTAPDGSDAHFANYPAPQTEGPSLTTTPVWLQTLQSSDNVGTKEFGALFEKSDYTRTLDQINRSPTLQQDIIEFATGTGRFEGRGPGNFSSIGVGPDEAAYFSANNENTVREGVNRLQGKYGDGAAILAHEIQHGYNRANVNLPASAADPNFPTAASPNVIWNSLLDEAEGQLRQYRIAKEIFDSEKLNPAQTPPVLNMGGAFLPGDDKSARAIQIEQWLDDGAELYRHGLVPSPDYLARANLAVDIGNNEVPSLGATNYVDYYANEGKPSAGHATRMQQVEITGIENGTVTVVFSGVGDETRFVRLTQPMDAGAEGPWNAEVCRRIPVSGSGTPAPSTSVGEQEIEVVKTVSSDGRGNTTVTDNASSTTTPEGHETNQPPALVNIGDTAPDSIAITGPDGSDAHFLHHPAPSAAVPLAEGLTLVNTLIGLKNWGSQSDLSHLSTAVNLYNQFDHLGTAFGGNGNNLPGDLGQFGAGVSLITSLQSGNPIAIASSGASFYNSIVGANAANAIPIPVLNILNIGNALQSGDPFAVASSVAACFPPWGTVASVVISILGGLRKPDIPPPPDGAVHYTFDETGAITIQTDHNVSGGAATANSTAGSVLGLLQSVVTDHNAKNDTAGHSNNNLGIDPSRMPRIGFTAGMSWLEITHADGSTTKETINPATVGERLLQIAVENDALAPVWQIQTAQAHAKAEHAAPIEAQAQAQAQATTTDQPAPENTSAIDGQSPISAPATTTPSTVHNTAAVFGTEGKVQEAADHKTQTFSALVVHLRSPGAQDAVAAIATPTPATNTVLQDVDGDGFWEQTQWVASKDDAGNAQGMLVLDHNNNRLIEAADILHLGGNSNERNSLAWLDANADGKLDASDPAFAAIKVFIDINSNGQVDDGEMQSPQLSSINFTTGQINYTEGPSASLTATTLSGDTEGIKLDTIKVVDEDGKLQELKVGSVLVHEGYQGMVRVNSKGEIVADDDPAADNRWVAQRINNYEFNAAHLSDWEGTAEQDQHRHGGGNAAGAPTETSVTGATSIGAVLGKENVKTTTTMDVGDKRLVSDAPKTTAVGTTDHKPNTTITLNAGDARIRSLTPAENAQRVVFVPSGVREGWMTADGKEMLQLPEDGLFGNGGMTGALMAVALGAVQSTAFAKADADDTGFTWQTTPLLLDGAGANTANPNQTLNTNTSETNTGAIPPSTIALGNYTTTVHRVRLGVRLSAAPLADASAASYTLADTAAPRTSNTQTPTSATHYASANLVAADANTGPTQTLIDNQLKPKAKTPTDSTTTPPADPALDAGSPAPADPTTSTTTPATPPSTTPAPPSPTLVATPPTAPAAVTPTPGNDQLSNNPLEDASLHVSFATLMANDVNASSITAVGNATHGSVAIIGGEVVFTPSANYHGPASFVYQVVSTDGNFALGEAGFDISGVNDVPVVLGESAGANEDVALVLSQTTLLANDTDVDVATDGQSLSVSAVGNASNGTVSILGNGSVQFTPDANFHGTASFKYVVSDGHGGSATATATVQVAAVNDVPVALGEVIASAEDTTLLINPLALLANDTDADVATDGQTLSISAVSNASHGTVSVLGSGQIQFIPDANYVGTASFDYVVSDGHGGTATTTANILVGSTNDAPVASGETVNSQEDQVVTLTAAALLANETDVENPNSSLSISRVTAGAGGSVVLSGGNVLFTPNANFSGTASFTYWVRDPDGMESNAATVTVNVAPVNDAPYAQGDVLSGASEDATFNIDRMALLGNDGDEEDSNSSLGIELVGNASSGTVSMGAGGNLVFTPVANFNGNVSFQYQVRDTSGALSPAVTAQFNVAAVNDNPVGVDETLTPMYTNTATSPSTATIGFTTLLTNDSDVDNPASDLTVSGVRNASNGTVSIVAGAVSFTPTLDFNGTASFEYQVNDQYGGQTWATAFISVAPPPNLYPSINVTYFNFYPTGTTPAGAWDVGNLNWSIADDGNTGLVSVTYLSGSYHVFGDPGGPQGSLPWNTFATTQTSWYVDVQRTHAVDSFTTTWRVVDDRGLENTWHFNYTVGSGTQSYMDFTGYAPPVVLGLNGNSPNYISTQYSNVRFDLNGDGIADQVAWAAPGSGVLGIDLNGDQKISNANEFTFTQYVPGAKTDLEGLHAFDTNHNGVLDTGDAQWAQFGVWEDKDSDGQTQDGEYQTLDALGIASIDLNSRAPTRAQPTPADGHLTGVAVMGESAYTRTDGSTGQVDDAMFAFTARPTVVAPHSREAEVMRMALLFNQMCNTASEGGHAALGFVPIQADGHWQDAVVATPQTAWQETQSGA